MPQSVFVCANTCAIDQIAPSATYPSIGDVGVLFLGGGKAALRRALATFDVFGSAAAGRPLVAADTVTLAELMADVTGITGPAFQVDAERLGRTNYNNAEATWNNYRAGTPWTTAGGDEAPPPAAAGFTSPSVPGDQVVQANLAPFVVDAISNRGGLVALRWKARIENPASSSIYTVFADPAHVPPLLLRVTYQSTEPTPIDRPAGGALTGAPASSPGRAAAPAPASPPARTLPRHRAGH